MTQPQPSTYRLSLAVPQVVQVNGRNLEREDFFGWLWDRFGQAGLLGVHEGTLLSEQAAEQGLNIESWTVDAGLAPRERDWIAAQGEASVELYFASLNEARAAQRDLRQHFGGAAQSSSKQSSDRSSGPAPASAAGGRISVGEIEEQKPQDWDAEWKRSFLNATDGVFIPPFWRILPAWVERELPAGERPLKINPGAGFGTGTHETTQLCLQAIGEFAASRGPGLLSGMPVLDFGSGSGILAIGAALLGAHVNAVEIDELAIENAQENARINSVESRIEYSRSLPRTAAGTPGTAASTRGQYPLVIANILRPVLVEFAPELVKRLAPGGCLVLSGLVQNDVAEIDRVFSALLGSRPQVSEKGEWRGIRWGK